MNIFGIVILTAVVVDVVLNGLADYLNLKMLRHDVPR